MLPTTAVLLATLAGCPSWDGGAATATYGAGIGSDLGSTYYSLGRGRVELNGLPGMRTDHGRIAWGSARLGMMLLADKGLCSAGKRKAVKRLRRAHTAAMIALAVVNITGIGPKVKKGETK